MIRWILLKFYYPHSVETQRGFTLEHKTNPRFLKSSRPTTTSSGLFFMQLQYFRGRGLMQEIYVIIDQNIFGIYSISGNKDPFLVPRKWIQWSHGMTSLELEGTAVEYLVQFQHLTDDGMLGNKRICPRSQRSYMGTSEFAHPTLPPMAHSSGLCDL